MKKIAFLLLLLPLFSNAQTAKEEENKLSDGILALVHADKTVSVPAEKKEGKKKPKDNTKYMGAVQFKIGNNQISCDSALVMEDDDLVEAYNVTLTNPIYFTTKGGQMNFNRETKKGNVTKNVIITALNGSVIGNSEDVEVDMSHEAYRIGLGSITPPGK